MGEQSNAYRILLRYDRKSRHRRIKKQRRYERLAATSQFRYIGMLEKHAQSPTKNGCSVGSDRTFSGGRSPYIKPNSIEGVGPKPWRALSCPASPFRREPGAGSAADCLYFNGLLPVPPVGTAHRGVTAVLGTENMARDPRNQVCCLRY